MKINLLENKKNSCLQQKFYLKVHIRIFCTRINLFYFLNLRVFIKYMNTFQSLYLLIAEHFFKLSFI